MREPLMGYLESYADLERVTKLNQFRGVMCLDKYTCLIQVLPHGVFIGYYGKAKQCFDIKKVAFRRKLPKMGFGILSEIISYFSCDLTVEACVRILYDTINKEYIILKAQGIKDKVSIVYDFSPYIDIMCREGMVQMCEIHSHNTMPAFWSSTDDADEQYPMVFGVIGNLNTFKPSMKFRCWLGGVYGDISPDELFIL